jgi:UDP-N-acetylmuramyl pentapeptide phosphotransferase/UDP-N-acetylglucosamine-1-phosphate transferase
MNTPSLGSEMENGIASLALIACALVFLWVLRRAFRQGKFRAEDGPDYYRNRQPIAFRGGVILFVLLILGSLAMAIWAGFDYFRATQ